MRWLNSGNIILDKGMVLDEVFLNTLEALVRAFFVLSTPNNAL